MFFDHLVKQGLRNGRIVHFAVAMTAISDQVDDNVAAECVAIFESHATDSYYGINVLGIDVKDRNILPASELRGEMSRMQLARL